MFGQSTTSRGPFGFLGATFAGGVSGMLFVFALAHPLAGHPLINAYLTSIPLLLAFVPLFMAALGAGSLAGLVAVMVATAGLFTQMSSNIGVIYTFIFGVPSVALSALALRYRHGVDGKTYWYPETFLSAALAIYPCLVFIALVALTGSHNSNLLAITTESFTEMAKKLPSSMDSDVVKTLQQAAPVMAKIAPAALAWGWVSMAAIGLWMAQLILQKMRANIRSPFVLRDLSVPRWVFAATFGAWLVGALAPAPFDYLGGNIGMILSLTYFFAGLTIVHAFVATTKIKLFLLIVFYVVLSVIAWLAVLVTLVGMVDQWMNFRQRWIPVTKGVES